MKGTGHFDCVEIIRLSSPGTDTALDPGHEYQCNHLPPLNRNKWHTLPRFRTSIYSYFTAFTALQISHSSRDTMKSSKYPFLCLDSSFALELISHAPYPSCLRTAFLSTLLVCVFVSVTDSCGECSERQRSTTLYVLFCKFQSPTESAQMRIFPTGTRGK